MSTAYEELEDFLLNRMRMSHIYQPVMLKVLLQNGGQSTVNEIAKALLAQDRSQIEYYEKITKNMPGKVLTRNRGITERDKDTYRLKGYDNLSPAEVDSLIALCGQTLAEYLEKRGSAPWQHRTNSSGYISGTIRYEVLKRAKGRCELCGIGMQDKALEVDHIVPRSKGGSDDITNLQALCYSCNAMKRDTDDTDFRGMVEDYEHREASCIFCELPDDRVIMEDDLFMVIGDAYPVTPRHTLLIPKRHVTDYFRLYQPELNSMNRLLQRMKDQIVNDDDTVAGFNIGMNCGETAGQTVNHCHIHLIPRRAGDMDNPAGGVRGVIPDKMKY